MIQACECFRSTWLRRSAMLLVGMLGLVVVPGCGAEKYNSRLDETVK